MEAATDFVNLSSWTVTFTRAPLGAWEWEAEHTNGTTLSNDLGLFADKANAEADAVKKMERYERGLDREEINGFKLAERVRSR